jgi:hypothetical protein
MRKLLSEPLVHFLVLGAVLFLVFDLTAESDQPQQRRIVVTPGQLEQLTGQFSRTWMRPPTPTELEGLVREYVRSEIYYREALAMGLDQDDPYVRNRLALKLEVLLDGLSAEADPGDEELSRFLEAHAERFAEPARLSFRQLYLNPDRHADPLAKARLLRDLLRGGADPAELGDVSMLAPGLDAASAEVIARQFGEDFAAALLALEPGDWVGPVRSTFGLHLVQVSQQKPARQPALAEVRDAVLTEWRDQRRREAREDAYRRLRERYDVVVEPESEDQAGTDSGATAGSAPVREDSVAVRARPMTEATGRRP